MFNKNLDIAADSALLIVDVQKDFCTGGALAVPCAEEIFPAIIQLEEDFARAGLPVIATQDWHPQNHCSFDTHGGLWPVHCVQNSSGAQIHCAILQAPIQLIVRKGCRSSMDSYSAFFENDKVTPTGLNAYLQERGIQNIYIGGLALDFCVRFTALDAAVLGYNVFIVNDAVRAVDNPFGSAEEARCILKAAGIRFL